MPGYAYMHDRIMKVYVLVYVYVYVYVYVFKHL